MADILLCPVCNDSYNHIYRHEIYPVLGTRKYTIACGVFDVNYDKKAFGVRGFTFETHYQCEGGHKWMQTHQFHKGEVFVETEIIDARDSYDEDDFMDDIWRD